jgi:hypothetical protein
MQTRATLSTKLRVWSRRPVAATLLVLAIAGVLSAALWTVRWDATTRRAYPDSYWYAKQTATFAGMSQREAERFAASTICHRGQPTIEGWPNCQDGMIMYAHIWPERYNRILDTRPGYPLFAAPFVAVFGESGMTIATLLLGVIAGMAAALIVRLLGGSPIQSFAAVVLLYLLPTGYWMTRLLGDVGAVATTLVTLCAAIVLLRAGTARARLAAAGLVAAGLFATSLVRPANGALLGLALAGVAALFGIVTLVRRQRPDRRVLILLGVGLGVVVVWQVIGVLFNLPGITESVQDKYTSHFTRPDIPDPWHRLWLGNLEYWPVQLKDWTNGDESMKTSPVLAALVGGIYVLFRTVPWREAMVLLAAGLTSVASLLAHPIMTESDRLLIFAWLPVLVGLAMVARRRERPAPAAEPAPAVPRQRTPDAQPADSLS